MFPGAEPDEERLHGRTERDAWDYSLRGGFERRQREYTTGVSGALTKPIHQSSRGDVAGRMGKRS